MSETCKTCVYWCQGDCRRYPQFVPRKPDEWCGEHPEKQNMRKSKWETLKPGTLISENKR